MLMLFIVLLGNLSNDVTVTMPDTASVQQVFRVQVTYSGTTGGSFNCNPVYYSPELQYFGTSTSSSYRSISTPSGRQVTSEITVIFSFNSATPGIYTVGPFLLTGDGFDAAEIPAEEIVIVGDGGGNATAATGDTATPANSDYWFEVDYEIDGLLYPGMSFTTVYYLCTKYQDLNIHSMEMTPSEYISGTVIEQAAYYDFQRTPKRYFRADVMELEFTPMLPCTASLPRIAAVMSRNSLFASNKQTKIISPDIRLPVYPFPDEGRPDNFTYACDSISLWLEPVPGSFSTAGEKNLRLHAFQSGRAGLESIPKLTFSGPVEVSCGDRQHSGSSVYWDIVVHPSDSGTLVIGPDSAAWFDRSENSYKQALIPSCTLALRMPIGIDTPPALPQGWNEKLPAVFWIILSGVILILPGVFMFFSKRKMDGGGVAVENAIDAEDLLTAMEMSITELFCGKSRWIGYEELDELLSDNISDNILTGRILRHWKNLEMLLSRKITEDELSRLRQKTIDILGELRR